MVKSISAVNSTVRNFVFGAAIAGTAMLLGASSPVKNTRAESEPQRTELMSEETANALRVNVLQQNPTVPSVHNKKLDDMLLRFYDKEEDKINAKAFIDQLYEDWGTYGASALIQTQIDVNMFVEFLNGNAEILKRFPYGENRYKDATKYSHSAIDKVKQPIMEWLEPNYSKAFAPVFSSFDHKPAADELITALDNYVKKNEYNLFKGAYFNEYSNPSTQFKDDLDRNLGEIQNASDLIAYKIHRANQMLFSQLLNANGINISNYRDWGNENTIFYSGYMQAVNLR